jgi:hypothetical protein
MNIYYVAAKETMQAGFATYFGIRRRDFSRTDLAPKVLMSRRKKDINPNDTENIKIALADGWVTFPQGRLSL